MALDMDPEIRTRWATALRSGKYKQGRGYLQRADDTFCCLGVLCQLAVEAGATDPPELSHDGIAWTFGEGSITYLPEDVTDWAGLNDHNPLIEHSGRNVSLAAVNDGIKSYESGVAWDIAPGTFSEIADLIEGVPA